MANSVYSPRYRQLLRTLIEARKAIGLSQSALAVRLKRLQTFVSKYERGERRLDVIEFLDVVTALELDPCVVIRELWTMDGN